MTPGSQRDGGHYFEREPATASRPRAVELVLPDLSATLRTDTGVFSGSGVDPGTRILLSEMVRGTEAAGTGWPEGDLVDLGCGYGPIAIALALRHPQRHVWAVDTNLRALELAQANAITAGVAERITCVTPEAFPDDTGVAAIVSNPPIRIGKAALHEMLALWIDRLRRGGEAWLVVQKHLGADSLARWLAEHDWETGRVTSRRGYRVLRVMAGEPGPP